MNTNLAVSNIMTTKLITIKPDDTLEVVQKIFKDNLIHHIPVVDKGKQLKGMISKVDMLTFLNGLSTQTTGPTWSKYQFATITASRVMTEELITIEPDDTMGLAADIFLSNKLHALPVVESGELLGLVTSHDLLKFAFKDAVEAKEGWGITQ